MLFKIEYIAQKARPAFLFARQLEAGKFHLSSSSCLGGVPIRQHLAQPRALKPDGSPDLTVFAFTLVTANDLPKLSLGQYVELSDGYSQGVGDAV
jgi:hypothetical protein